MRVEICITSKLLKKLVTSAEGVMTYRLLQTA